MDTPPPNHPSLPVWARLWIVLLLAPSSWLDFTTWTGLFVIDEYLIWAAALAILGWLTVLPLLPRPRLKRDPLQLALFGLIALALCASLAMAWLYLPNTGPNTFWSYLEFGNSVRLGLGFAVALAVIPTLRALWRVDPEACARFVRRGLYLAAAGAAVTLLWERAAFPGLLDFSSDYRTSGFFSDMRVGGAALDGYLSLVVPFVALAAIGARTWWRRALMGALFVLLLYAVMSTFSRALQLGLVVSCALIVLFVASAGSGQRRRTGADALWVAFTLALCAALLASAFLLGGYRALAAVTLWLGALLYSARTEGIRGSVSGALAALACALIALGLHGWLPKGPYIAFAWTVLVWCAAAAWRKIHGRHSKAKLYLLSIPMAGSAIAVCAHWAESAAAGWALLTALATCYAASLAFRLPRPRALLGADRVFASLLTGIALVAIAVPILGTYRMAARLESIQQNWNERLQHWQLGLSLTGADWTEVMFGKGLGTFPHAYYLSSRQSERPGSLRREAEAGGPFVRLFRAGIGTEFGEPLRLSQRVRPLEGEVLEVTGMARAADKASVSVSLCEKWLLYPYSCTRQQVNVAPGLGWQPFRVKLQVPVAWGGPWYAPRFAVLALAGDPVVDVTRLAAQGSASGRQLRNGAFERGLWSWYVSSDHTHLPWHAKSLPIGLYFDGGLVLLGAFALLGLALAGRLIRRLSQGDLSVLDYAAALVGFAMVSAFDTVLDAPRVAFVFMLLCSCALSAARIRALRPR